MLIGGLLSMEDIIIEKGVPIPGKHFKDGPLFEIIRKMEIGDSVVRHSYSAAQSISRSLREIGRKGSYRMQDDGSYRIWRIE